MTAKKKPALPEFEAPSDPSPVVTDHVPAPEDSGVSGDPGTTPVALPAQPTVGTRTLESPQPGSEAHSVLVAEIEAAPVPVALWSGKVGFFHSLEDPGGLVIVAVDDKDGTETVKPIPGSVLKRGEFIAKMMGVGKLFGGGFGGLD